MLFVLTTARGQTLRFNVLSCAQLYQAVYGGTIVGEWRPEFEVVE
jgi:hypothetical protein